MADRHGCPYYHTPCPLCQEDVDVKKPACYRILPLRRTYFNYLQEAPHWTSGVVFVQGVLFQPDRFRGTRYTDRAVLIHRRCLSFVRHLSPGMLCRLLDLMEPTFLRPSTGPPSEHGAFHNPHTSPPSPDLDVAITGLPGEIWNMISRHDVGRLEFLVRLVSQLEAPGLGPLVIPDSRFDVDTVDIPGAIMRIHLVRLGGRTYISHVSDPGSSGDADTRLPYRDYRFGESKCLAVKTDGIGVVDLALDESHGRPNWIFDSHTSPFGKEMSRVRDADLHRLRLIRDSMKCRAILTTNRGGVEPYFDADSMPPGNSWINSSLRIGSWPTEQTDPSTYLAHARYISFEHAETITFYLNLIRLGITEIYVNDSQHHRGHCVRFPDLRSSRTLKVSVCRLGAGQQHPFIQFNIDGQWVPSLPHSGIIIQQVVLDNVIGIWLGDTFPLEPVHIGVVRDESAPCLLPRDQMMKVPDLSMFTSRW
ncbi:hypothetical protein MaudCBS49596_000662 [Microsporum audouinii]